MRLVLQRMNRTGVILGSLTVDGVHNCFTLEDPDAAHDRIDAGTYKVIIDDSTRFKRKMPHIIGSAAIDDRGIRIHAGNTEADTVGCVLVGQEHTSDALQLSKAAFDPLFETLSAAQARGEEITLEVLDAVENPPAKTPESDRSLSGPALPYVQPLPATRQDILVCLVTFVQRALRAFQS